jgi:hypothetical protein
MKLEKELDIKTQIILPTAQKFRSLIWKLNPYWDIMDDHYNTTGLEISINTHNLVIIQRRARLESRGVETV